MKNPKWNNPSRRDFVKQSGIIMGGIMAAPLLSRANYFAGSDDVIKVAVVGCGGRGTGAAMQALSSKQNVKIVAMCDAFKDNLDNCHKSLTDEINGGIGDLSKRLDVPEERKFTGCDGYLFFSMNSIIDSSLNNTSSVSMLKLTSLICLMIRVIKYLYRVSNLSL